MYVLDLAIEVHLVLVLSHLRWGRGLQRAGGYPVLLAWRSCGCCPFCTVTVGICRYGVLCLVMRPCLLRCAMGERYRAATDAGCKRRIVVPVLYRSCMSQADALYSTACQAGVCGLCALCSLCYTLSHQPDCNGSYVTRVLPVIFLPLPLTLGAPTACDRRTSAQGAIDTAWCESPTSTKHQPPPPAAAIHSRHRTPETCLSPCCVPRSTDW